MSAFDSFLAAANAFLWQNTVLFIILGTGIVFTIWSRFSQFRALTHGVQAIRGKYDHAGDPGAISHFQALSAALSATVGLGNIGGVAMAISLGGPGAVFWMWVVGFFGMALKTTEVTLAMLYRNTDNPDNPHGGTMWVISRALAERGSGLGRELYERFFEVARAHGRRTVSCVTSPANAGSLAFHQAIGFEPSAPQAGYDGPGEDRVVLTRSI